MPTNKQSRLFWFPFVLFGLLTAMITLEALKNGALQESVSGAAPNDDTMRTRSSVHELVVLPRSAKGCALPYGHAVYRGVGNARHGWEITIATVHTCVDCPTGSGCVPGIYSFGAAVLPSGRIVDNQFLTILSAGPGDESEMCDGFDNYVVRWEETRQLKQMECGRMYTFAIQYPIRIRITPKSLSSSGTLISNQECRELIVCEQPSKSITVVVDKHDVLHREVVVPFRPKE